MRIQLKFKYINWQLYAGILAVVILLYTVIQLFLLPQISGNVEDKKKFVQSVVEPAQVQSSDRIEIASHFNGKVISVPVVEGQTVKAGQALIVLENSDDRAALTRSHAAVNVATAKLRKVKELTLSFSEQSLMRAQATHSNAKKQYERTRELSGKGYVSQTQLDDSLRNFTIAQTQLQTAKYQARSIREKDSDYNKAESALNRARENERLALDKLANIKVAAEVDGVIMSINVVKGSEVVAGKPLMVITTGNKMPFTVQVDENYLRI